MSSPQQHHGGVQQSTVHQNSYKKTPHVHALATPSARRVSNSLQGYKATIKLSLSMHLLYRQGLDCQWPRTDPCTQTGGSVLFIVEFCEGAEECVNEPPCNICPVQYQAAAGDGTLTRQTRSELLRPIIDVLCQVVSNPSNFAFGAGCQHKSRKTYLPSKESYVPPKVERVADNLTEKDFGVAQIWFAWSQHCSNSLNNPNYSYRRLLQLKFDSQRRRAIYHQWNGWCSQLTWQAMLLRTCVGEAPVHFYNEMYGYK